MLIRLSKCNTGTMVQRLRQDWEAQRALILGANLRAPLCALAVQIPGMAYTAQCPFSHTHQQQLPRASSQHYFPKKLAQLLRNLWHRNSLSQRWCFQIVFPVGFSQPVCTSGTGNGPRVWAPQLPSHVVKNLLSLISTYHPSGSNPARCEPQSVFKTWRGKKGINMLT